jgi:hypothetical protein
MTPPSHKMGTMRLARTSIFLMCLLDYSLMLTTFSYYLAKMLYLNNKKGDNYDGSSPLSCSEVRPFCSAIYLNKMQNPGNRRQDPSTGSEHVRTPLEKQRDFADAQSSRGGFRLRLNLPHGLRIRRPGI